MTLARYQFIENYIQRLRGALHYYTGYIPHTSFIAEAYDAVQQDAVVQSSIQKLSLLTAGKTWSIEAQDDQDKRFASMVEDGLKRIKDFTHARKSLGNGVLYGMGLLKKKWEWKRCRIGIYKGLWCIPTELQEVDPRRLRIERPVENRKLHYWTIWDYATDKYVVLEDKAVNPQAEHAVQDYIWYFDEHQEDQPYGVGLGHHLYSTCFMKSQILQYKAELAETWARPWLIGKVDLSAGVFSDTVMAASGAFSSKASRVDTILDTLDKMRARHVMVMGTEDELDIREHGSATAGILTEFIQYLDNQIRSILLGSPDTSHQSQGSFARQKVYQGEQDAIVAYRRDRLEEVITRDLMWDFVYRNRLHFLKVGIPEEDKVFFRIKDEIRDEEDKQKRRENAQLALDRGIPLLEAELYEALGFTQPLDSDSIFQPPQPQQPPGMGMPPGMPGMDPGASPGGAPPLPFPQMTPTPSGSPSIAAQAEIPSDLLSQFLKI